MTRKKRIETLVIMVDELKRTIGFQDATISAYAKQITKLQAECDALNEELGKEKREVNKWHSVALEADRRRLEKLKA